MPVRENELSRHIIDAAVDVHRELGGPGLLESIYEEALVVELTLRGFSVRRQVPVPIMYKGYALSRPMRLDLLVEELVIVETKAVAKHHEIFLTKALTYSKLSNKRLALIINFGLRQLRQGVIRVVNGLPDS